MCRIFVLSGQIFILLKCICTLIPSVSLFHIVRILLQKKLQDGVLSESLLLTTAITTTAQR